MILKVLQASSAEVSQSHHQLPEKWKDIEEENSHGSNREYDKSMNECSDVIKYCQNTRAIPASNCFMMFRNVVLPIKSFNLFAHDAFFNKLLGSLFPFSTYCLFSQYTSHFLSLSWVWGVWLVIVQVILHVHQHACISFWK